MMNQTSSRNLFSLDENSSCCSEDSESSTSASNAQPTSLLLSMLPPEMGDLDDDYDNDDGDREEEAKEQIANQEVVLASRYSYNQGSNGSSHKNHNVDLRQLRQQQTQSQQEVHPEQSKSNSQQKHTSENDDTVKVSNNEKDYTDPRTKLRNSAFLGEHNMGSSFLSFVPNRRKEWKTTLSHHCDVIRAYPFVLLLSLAVYILLMACGSVVIFYVSRADRQELTDRAINLATDAGQWFSNHLDQAVLPLYSTSLFVQEMNIFHDLFDQIGPAYAEHSAPFLPPTFTTFRNVTGICDNSTLIQQFSDIAGAIKRSSNLDGILVALEISPQGVVCLVHPRNNTMDFDDPNVFLDNTKIVGLDTLVSPDQAAIGKRAIKSDSVVIAGPITLKQCQDCVPAVKDAFIARLAIPMAGKEIIIDGQAYEKWGHAVALINWSKLVELSGLYEMFEKRGMGFQLTRTDQIIVDSAIESEQVVVLAESPFFARFSSSSTVTTALDTTDNQWEMTVAYDYDNFPPWVIASIFGNVFLSLFIAALVYILLFQQYGYIRLEKKYEEKVASPQKMRIHQQINDNQEIQDESNLELMVDGMVTKNSDYIADDYNDTSVLVSDIAGFTAWSAKREPEEVFKLLQAVFFAFDAIARTHGVFKVETIGDSYVAVTGLPEPQADHAVRMIRFASECNLKFKDVIKDMQKVMPGPDTEGLLMRWGIHSGPVTAGVLVGERSRMEVFGQTVDIAATLEHTGQPDRIQISERTANLLKIAKLEDMVEPRDRLVHCSVTKEDVQTYWVTTSTKRTLARKFYTLAMSLLICVVVFVALCGSGITMITVVSSSKGDEARTNALDSAGHIMDQFADAINHAILPVFLLSQFASETQSFYDLSESVTSNAAENNTQLVCSDIDLVAQYTHLIDDISHFTGNDNILLDLQLMPNGIPCLGGDFVKHFGVDTMDLVLQAERQVPADVPADGKIDYEILLTDDILLLGPVSVSICDDCELADIGKVFVARLAVRDYGNNNNTNGNSDNNDSIWGYIIAFMKWNEIFPAETITADFQQNDLEFQLKKIDAQIDQQTGLVVKDNNIVHESPNFGKNGPDTVSTVLKTANAVWILTISFKHSWSRLWLALSILISVFGSAFIAGMTYKILMQQQRNTVLQKKCLSASSNPEKLRLRIFLDDDLEGRRKETSQRIDFDEPVADQFSDTTVLFASIAGFSDWSATRDPSDIFVLLQAVFSAFDKLARKHDVFKVETTGGSYVAVTGVPDPQDDHAVRMIDFATHCLMTMKTITRLLVPALGEDTKKLGVQLGLHSGAITAGFLVGDRSRFQVFGDTINTAARIYTNGLQNRIHLSQQTANLLMLAGKKEWVEPRKETIYAKGKGQLQTYWLDLSRHSGKIGGRRVHRTSMRRISMEPVPELLESALESSTNIFVGVDIWGELEPELNMDDGALMDLDEDKKLPLLIQWNEQCLLGQLKKIVAKRNNVVTAWKVKDPAKYYKRGETICDEVKDIITMSKFKDIRSLDDKECTAISEEAIAQLHSLVEEIADLYNSNSFHNFEHASHVTMIAKHIIDSISSPTSLKTENLTTETIAKDIESYKMAIAGEPLVQFAILFSALIHDANHRGIPNSQLSKEDPCLSAKYRHQSLAEQRSVELAWRILMDPRKIDLQQCLFADQTEVSHFRQLVVNLVVATDIADDFAKTRRNMRWRKAFHSDKIPGLNSSSRHLHPNDSNRSLEKVAAAPGSTTSAPTTTTPPPPPPPSPYQQPSPPPPPRPPAVTPTMSRLTKMQTSRRNMLVASTRLNFSTKNLNNVSSRSLKHEDETQETLVTAQKHEGNRKATLALEQISQVADIGHTMQCWDVYRKWNERLFDEMYTAWKKGRLPKNPSLNWYDDELLFFDRVVIPLSKKFEHSNLIGDASNNCVVHASNNRRQWEAHGKAIIAELLEKYGMK